MTLNNYITFTFVVAMLATLGSCHTGEEPLQGWLMERQEKPICDGMGDGYCNDENNNRHCEWDGRRDCCDREHRDWDSKCTDCKCFMPDHPNFDVSPGKQCKDLWEQGPGGDMHSCNQELCDMCNKKIEDSNENPAQIQACKNYRNSLCRKTCKECSAEEPLDDGKCLNMACSELWEDDDEYEGVCVDLYHNRWSNIEEKYDVSVDAKKVAADMGYGNKTLCKPSATAYKDPNRDCCRCFRKEIEKPECPGPHCPPEPCSDNGCDAEGGQCVNLLNADLTDPTKGPRSMVDLDQRLADGLCHKPNKRHCCDCYMRKNETLIS